MKRVNNNHSFTTAQIDDERRSSLHMPPRRCHGQAAFTALMGLSESHETRKQARRLYQSLGFRMFGHEGPLAVRFPTHRSEISFVKKAE